MKTTKQELRTQIKEKISSLSENSLANESKLICSKIINSKDFKDSSTLLAYMPLKDEVNITPVIFDALKNNKAVFLPRIVPGTNHMEFYRYTADTHTAQGSYGITEPEADESQNFLNYLKNSSPAATSTNQTLMLVPGRAFTKDGRRLGRGKGFYDIYFLWLAALGFSEGIKKSGVCFACQILADLPTTPDDVLMDTVVSTSSTTAHSISGE